jgi:signal transduction histidine kinase
MHSSPGSDKQSLHWSQWIWPGPRRVFTADEMSRAGAQPWRKAVDHYVLGNLIVLLAIHYHDMPRGQAPGLAAGSVLLTSVALWVARQLWARPTRHRLNLFSLAAGLVLVGLALALKQWLGREAAQIHLLAYVPIVLVACSAWWMLTLMRVQQIEARLTELDERERSLKLTRRLAAAQIQPHFLFNTLASLQHWVDSADPRAGPTLRSFTGYLRGTLPMFERDTLLLDEELALVRSYLEVMQARLGERLRWSIEIEAGVSVPPLPPGVLLTLAENAIAHGIEPSLRGGSIRVRIHTDEPGALLLDVCDDGQGLCAEQTDGVGLANTRQRLAQLFGAQASLQLLPLQPGCMQRIRIETSVEGAKA